VTSESYRFNIASVSDLAMPRVSQKRGTTTVSDPAGLGEGVQTWTCRIVVQNSCVVLAEIV